eukprot:UN2064
MGFGDVMEGASAWELRPEALPKAGPGQPITMWVQEGDEFFMVDAHPCGGVLEKPVEFLANPGDSFFLNFFPPKRGNVQLVFPDVLRVTFPGRAPFRDLAASPGFQWPGGWFVDQPSGERYVLPSQNCCPRVFPSAFSPPGEDALNRVLGVFPNWVPLFLKRDQYQSQFSARALKRK